MMFVVLQAAAEWGISPWELAEGDPLTWIFRWIYLKEQLAKAD